MASQAIVAELDGKVWEIEQFAWKVDQIMSLLDATQEEQFKAIWGVSPGPGEKYHRAKAERKALYRHIQARLKQEHHVA
jgi:hypothetical protein